MKVHGMEVDKNTRCAHYHSEVDIIAVKMHCCREYYACYYCHEETADHSASRWPEELWGEKAVLCGNCWNELSIHTYRSVNSCPECSHPFNEKCYYHYPLYFKEQPE